MNFHVLVEIGFLGEAVSTVGDRAHIRPLLGVNSKVVKEVVPLAENLFAVGVTA